MSFLTLCTEIWQEISFAIYLALACHFHIKIDVLIGINLMFITSIWSPICNILTHIYPSIITNENFKYLSVTPNFPIDTIFPCSCIFASLNYFINEEEKTSCSASWHYIEHFLVCLTLYVHKHVIIGFRDTNLSSNSIDHQWSSNSYKSMQRQSLFEELLQKNLGLLTCLKYITLCINTLTNMNK